MSTTTPINGFTIPALADSQSIVTATQPFLDALDSRMVPRFATLTARNSSITSPTEGQLSAVEENNEIYRHTGSTWISGPCRHKVKIQQSQFISQNTNFVVDQDLWMPLEPNFKYMFNALIVYFSPAGSHFKTVWSIPPGASGRMSISHKDANSSSHFFQGNIDITAQQNGFSDNSHAYVMFQYGRITTSSTLGNLQLTWSQLNSSAGSTFSCSGSWMKLWKIN